MDGKTHITAKDIENLSSEVTLRVPINGVKAFLLKAEPPLEEQAKVLVAALDLALPDLIYCIQNEMKAKAATTAARANVSRIEDDLRALRGKINNPENPRLIDPFV